MLDAFLVENNTFRPFNAEHWAVLLVGLLGGTALILDARRRSPRQQVLIGAVLGYSVGVSYLLFFTAVDIYVLGHFDPGRHLPFAMCNLSAVTIGIALHRKHDIALEILFFWIMSGTLAAVLLPEPKQSFPHYKFIVFWAVHIGLIVAALYAVFVHNLTPKPGSLVRAFLALNLYAVLIGIVNWLLSDYDANYFYVCHKPDTWTPLEWFGPWPWYIFFGQLLALSIFIVILLPFVVYRRFVRTAAEQEQDTPQE